MQAITYFYFDECPYCQQANGYLDSLIEQRPEYGRIPITRINERKQPDIADKYDYYYVPTFYVGAKKVHEGASTREKIEMVLKRALEAEKEAIG
ncbi:MAG: thioredoxin family protein [Oscillospiraceae bacterium]|jgi:glutaredoxin|nr:thioredoxin family protein [Oscillospiraceae bacterium]